MPKGQGLYKRKGAKGRIMYFRDGKMISKKSYLASASRRTATRTSPRRSTTRRKTTMARRRTYSRKRMAMPHPSITGMASGLSVAQYLNSGGGAQTGSTVLKLLGKSQVSEGLQFASANAVNLVTSDVGKKVLSSAIIIAAAGGVARKWFPNIKLGGSKIFMRI